MQLSTIIDKIKTIKKGSYVKFIKIKNLGKGYVKISNMVIRLGINYYKIKGNEEKEKNGLRWGTWVEGLENYVIENKGKYYLRAYNAKSKYKSKSKYYFDGEEVNKKEVAEALGEKKLESSESDCYNICFENIIQLGK